MSLYQMKQQELQRYKKKKKKFEPRVSADEVLSEFFNLIADHLAFLKQEKIKT